LRCELKPPGAPPGGGRTLGQADEAHHTIWLDNNAAGWGWFVDRSPGDDSEFSTAGDRLTPADVDPDHRGRPAAAARS
jgi:hypothetical protein